MGEVWHHRGFTAQRSCRASIPVLLNASVTRAILLIDHGSRRDAANQQLHVIGARLDQALTETGPPAIVECAHMELADPDIRAIILTGAGRAFSAGYDIGALPQSGFAQAAEAIVAHPFTAAIEALDAYPYPVLAALNGHAIGGGLELALSCDLRVCSADARLGMPPGRIGLYLGIDLSAAMIEQGRANYASRRHVQFQIVVKAAMLLQHAGTSRCL
jgi:enoyl-CoA hydratase/carnithine racemase